MKQVRLRLIYPNGMNMERLEPIAKALRNLDSSRLGIIVDKPVSATIPHALRVSRGLRIREIITSKTAPVVEEFDLMTLKP